MCAAQTLGGDAAYNFIKLSPSPMITALGGINVSYQTSEVSLSANNPALLTPELSYQFNASFNHFIGDVKAYSMTGAYHSIKQKTTFGGHVYFIDYGRIPLTDVSGNQTGEFRPADYVLQVSAARKYLEKWTYGGSIKMLCSNYSQYTSAALAFDFGLLYADTSKSITFSVVGKNMGLQLKAFGDDKEDLPFDLQVGVTKRLANAPFAFSLTARHLHRYDIHYNDQGFNNDNQIEENGKFNKLFNHFIIASHVYFGQNMEVSFGYNHLRRTELSRADGSNALTGFSTGIRVMFKKLQILYSRSSMQRFINNNHFGITVNLSKD